MDLFDPPSRLLLCFSNGSLSFYLFWSERLLNSLLLSLALQTEAVVKWGKGELWRNFLM